MPDDLISSNNIDASWIQCMRVNFPTIIEVNICYSSTL